MPYIPKKDSDIVGKRVVLTQEKQGFGGRFTVGSEVTITGVCRRGYTFEDEHGNRVIEAGFSGFNIKED